MKKKLIYFLMTAIAIGLFCGCDGCVELSAPTGLMVFNIHSSWLDLDWDKVAGAYCYEIECNDGSGWELKASRANGGPYTVGGLEADTRYSFRVRAIGKDKSITSEWSSTVSKKTLAD